MSSLLGMNVQVDIFFMMNYIPNFYNVHVLFLNEYMHSLTLSISTSNIEVSTLIMDLLVRYDYLETPRVNDG